MYIRLDVFHPVLWTVWNLSTRLIDLGPLRCFNNRLMRLSSITSCVVLVALICQCIAVEQGMILLSTSLTLGSTWWRYVKFPDMVQKSFIASPASESESWGGGRDPFWFSQKIYVTFSSNWTFPYQGGCSQFLISSWKFDSSICDWKNKISIFFQKYHFFRIESFREDFRCVHRLQLLKVCNKYVTLPNSHRVQSVSEEQSRLEFLSKLMDSWLVLRSYKVILNQWTKRSNRSFQWLLKTSFLGRLPIREQICDVSQIGVTFHGNLPTNFHVDPIATIQQRYLLLLCVPLSQQAHLFLICVVSTYNDSRKDLHRLCQIPRNCQCKWLQVSHLAPRTFASFFVFPEKFLFCTDMTGSIGWPSRAPRLHIDDCFEIHNLRWELCDLLLSSHQTFLLYVRLCQCVFCMGPL